MTACRTPLLVLALVWILATIPLAILLWQVWLCPKPGASGDPA